MATNEGSDTVNGIEFNFGIPIVATVKASSTLTAPTVSMNHSEKPEKN